MVEKLSRGANSSPTAMFYVDSISGLILRIGMTNYSYVVKKKIENEKQNRYSNYRVFNN